MDLAVVAAARKRVAPSPAWSLLFAKAFSTVAASASGVSRAYLPFPWPRLWQADESVATIAVEREYHGEPAVFFGFIKAADKLPLSELAAVLNEWRIKPVEEVRAFYRQISRGPSAAPSAAVHVVLRFVVVRQTQGEALRQPSASA